MKTEDKPHIIIHKDSSQVIGTYSNYVEAYKAYEELGWEMTDYAIGLVNDEIK
jgi:hypothetical protein